MAARKKAAPAANQPGLLPEPVVEKVRTNELDRRLHALWHIIVHKTKTCGPGCGAERWSPEVSEAEFQAAAASIARRWSALRLWPALHKSP